MNDLWDTRGMTEKEIGAAWFNEDVHSLRLEIEWRGAKIARLEAAGNEAFLAMCAYRDSPDEEVFQDAIDALGAALSPMTRLSGDK